MSEQSLLQEIRDNFTYCVDSWKDIREAGRIDMRYASGDAWDPEERKARAADKRLCLNLDEINQYVNQVVNDVRQNQRAVKVTPKGVGATAKTAELRADMIRQIEYDSKAQAAYCNGFEGAVKRSYGFWRVSKKYCEGNEFEQELCIRRIPNPDTVYLDPDYKEADSSDKTYTYVLDRMRRKQFAKRWKGAKITDFSSEHMEFASQWIGEDWVQVAEYWRLESAKRILLLIAPPPAQPGEPESEPERAYLDELPEGTKVQDSAIWLPGGQSFPLLNYRSTESNKVKQYLTNGVEILEENPWDGKYIPIIPCFGLEEYIDTGDGSKRVLRSLVRLARDAQTLYCYYRTTQAELVGMAPKAPYLGYEGQFENHESEWSKVNRANIPYLEVKATTDESRGAVLPLPRREPFVPAISELEIGAEAAKRAIQAAMGMYNASVGKRDSNGTSGIAIERLDQQSNQGSYHFIDNYDRALEFTGRVLDDLIKSTYDTARHVPVRKPNEEQAIVPINQEYQDEKTGETQLYRTDEGEHDVTISTGPSSDSQREEASRFADTLAGIPEVFGKIADLVIKLKNLGPIGDEIAKRLTPPEIAAEDQEIPPQAQQAIQQGQEQLQQLTAYVQQIEGELAEAKRGSDLKLAEVQSRERIASAEIESRDRIAAAAEETKRAVALAQLDHQQGIAVLQAELKLITQQLAGIQKAGQAATQPMPADLPIAA